jgi:hypothetical protein
MMMRCGRVRRSARCGGIAEGGRGQLLFAPCAQAGAAEKGLPLYKYIAELAGSTKLVRAPGRAGGEQGAGAVHRPQRRSLGIGRGWLPERGSPWRFT